MLKNLLLERFNMTVRLETRELPVYTLVRANADGRLGRQLVRRSEAECNELAARVKNGGTDTTASGRPLVGFRTGIDRISGGCTQLRSLVNALSRSPSVDRLIIDKTGLEGRFDYDLTWTPDVAFQDPGAAPGGVALSATAGTSLFTVLREQLGLRLEGSGGPVAVVVIDHAEMPE